MRHSALSALVVGASIALVGFGSSQQEAVATRTSQPPVIDGDLSDPVWSQAIPFDDFTQQIPDEGQPPSQRTEVRILYDEHAIYFGFRCFDTDPSTIVAQMTRRDRDSFSDNIWIDLDTRGDGQSAWHFELSASGVQRDGIRTGDVVELGAVDWEWDAVWHSAVRRDSQGWTAEIAIPFAELRYKAANPITWRMEIRRFIARRSEMDQWIFIPRTAFGEMLRYGPVVGLVDLPTSHALRLMPFVLGKARNRWSPAQLQLRRGLDSDATAGLDLRYGVAPNLTLNGTLLPDFGQVEADEVKLNLTTFELIYPEKRPFFLEGADLFALHNMYGLRQLTQPFYSRRVGAATANPYVPAGSTIIETPLNARVLGAAKLTGRIGRKVNVALLEGVTGRESATLGANGDETREGVAAPTNYFIGRLHTSFAPTLVGGVLVTSVLRKEPSGSLGLSGHCPDGGGAPSARGRCTHDATTATMDMNWSNRDGGLRGHATVFGSLISGGPPRTFRDGTVIGPGDTGIGWLAQVAKADGHLTGRAVYESASPRLDLNDAGFQTQQNTHRFRFNVWWREFNWGPTRKWNAGIQVDANNSWDGVRTYRFIDLGNASIEWKNAWKSTLDLERFLTVFDNRETRDGARTEKADQYGLEWTLTTDRTRRVSWNMQGALRTTWRGFSLSMSGSLVFRPSGRFDFSLGPKLDRVTGDPRFVQGQLLGDGSKRYIYGLQSVLSPGVVLRTTFTFTPNMTLQTYAQLFFASVRYSQLYELIKTNPKPNIYLSDLAPADGDPSSFDTRDAVLNVNAVFRWEYLPGSVLYLVYTRSHAGGLAPYAYDPEGQRIRPHALDFAALGRGPIEDVFLLKLSYYFAR